MEEIESLQQLYERLVEVTQNELELTNDLLPYQSDVVDYIVEQITHMNSVINKTKDRWTPFCIEQHKTELERFTYLINTYLRTRLKKIEANAPALKKLRDEDKVRARRFMSKLEREYLDGFYDSVNTYMKDILEQYMPPNMQKFEFKSAKEKDRHDYAFVIGCEEGTIVDGQSEVTIEPDVCRILTVSTIVDLLEKGSRQFKLI